MEPLDVTLQIPFHFRCPISLELMQDPVTVSTGQTYDRSSIESWIATGNTSCPVTRATLDNFTMIPNHTLRRLIQEWCVAHRSFGIERIPTPRQPADPGLVRSLLHRIASGASASQSRVAALRRLRTLACDSAANQSLISSPHARHLLVDLVFVGSLEELRSEALALLITLQLSESDCISIASAPERIDFLSDLLFHSEVEERVNSAALVEIVLGGTRSPDLRAQVCGKDEIFRGVIEILNRNSDAYHHPRAVKIGVKALLALCSEKPTRHNAIGAADVLMDRFSDFDKCDAERALAVIELLCRLPEGRMAFAERPVTVPLLVKSILVISDRATEYAAVALMAVCSDSERNRRDAVEVGVITQLLWLVQSDCTMRAKRKAQMLLKLLRDLWPQDSERNFVDFNFS